MNNGSKFHFTNEIVIVVTGAAITAKRDIDTAGKHLWDFAYTGGKLTIRRGIVRNMRSCIGQFRNIVLVKPDHMHQNCSRTEQADTLSVIDRRKPIFFVEVDFVSLDFSKVHGDTHVALAGKVAHLPVEPREEASWGARAAPDMDQLGGRAL